jgi:hypothetical protein
VRHRSLPTAPKTNAAAESNCSAPDLVAASAVAGDCVIAERC